MAVLAALARTLGLARRPRARLESAMASRRLAAWVPATRNINTHAMADGAMTLRRARELVLSTPLGAAAVDGFVGNAVGAGIKPSPLVDAEAKKRIQDRWLQWTDEADADGLTDFYGLEALVAREMFIAGECFVRLRPRRLEDGLAVPLQLQLLPAEMLPLSKSEVAANGNPIRCGIELDAIGRRVAYHFLRRHPGDATEPNRGWLPDEFSRVPAADVLHIRKPLEAGQLRGLPHITPALIRIYQMDRYIDAQVERQKIAAMYVGFVTSDANVTSLLGVERKEGEPATTAEAAQGNQAPPAVAVEPGQFLCLKPGENITLSSPPGVDNSFDGFWYRVCLELAAATGLPYSVLTGDLRQASYGSQRAGLVEFRRRMEQLQHAVFVYQLCRPVYQRWLDAAVLAGALALPGYAAERRRWQAVKWIPPRWEWIDPLKDRQAEKLAVDAGFKSRSDVVEAEGYDVEEVEARIKADRDREEALGISFAPGAGETQGARATPEQPEQPATAEEDGAEPRQAA